jgi:hypothetical protein
MMDLFAGQLAEHVANIYKGRGDRQHMIARSPAMGEEVWIGYETNPAIAAASYARGQGASEAKHINATEMIRALTGTDITWSQFKAIAATESTYERFIEGLPQGERLEREDFDAVNMPDLVKENQAKVEELKGQEELDEDQEQELQDAENFMWDSYRKLVKDRRVDAAKQPNAFGEAKKYMGDMLRNDEMMDRMMGFFKGLGVFKYLAGRVSAPVINLTAMVTSAPATMNARIGVGIARSFGYLGEAATSYGQYLWPKKMGALKDFELKRVFDDIRKNGWDKPQFNREALSVLESKVGGTWGRMVEALMYGFGVTEQLNRAATIAGAFKAIRANKPHLKYDQALKLAKEVSDEAHGVYGKVNLPGWARGSGMAANAGRAFYVFKTFSHNYLLNMAQMWGKGWIPEHGKAFAYMAIAPAILGGAGAAVGKELIFAMAKALGIGGDDPEEDFYKWLFENTGEMGERVGRFGLFGLAGISAKGSLQIAMTDLPTSIVDLLGAPGSIMKDVGDSVKFAARGDVWKAGEKAAPNFIANMMRGYREATEGVTTATNAPLFYGTKPLMADNVDAFLRFLSFNPAHIAQAREIEYREGDVEKTYSDMRNDITGRLKKFFLQPPEKQDKAGYADILQRIDEYNQRVMTRKLYEKGIPLLTGDNIRTNLKRAFQPSKKEKLREATGGAR